MNVVLGKAPLAVQIDVLPLLLRLQHDGSNWCITALSEPVPCSLMQKSIPSFMQKEGFSSPVCHSWGSWQMVQQCHRCRTHLQRELVWDGQSWAHWSLQRGCPCWGTALGTGTGQRAASGAHLTFLSMALQTFILRGCSLFYSRAQHPPCSCWMSITWGLWQVWKTPITGF